MSSSCCLLTTPELSVPCIAGHEVFLVAPAQQWAEPARCCAGGHDAQRGVPDRAPHAIIQVCFGFKQPAHYSQRANAMLRHWWLKWSVANDLCR